MLHPSTKKLIDKLAEMTRKRRIGWAETEDGRLAYQTEGYSVILGGEPQSVQLLSRDGKLLEEVSGEEIAETQADDGTPYQQAFSEMYREAARQARGTETAIDTVLAGLDLDGDGIPDVPAPEDGDEAGETLPEDTVDESWQGPAADAGEFASDTAHTPAADGAPEPNTPPFSQDDPAPAGDPAPQAAQPGSGGGFSGFGAIGGFSGQPASTPTTYTEETDTPEAAATADESDQFAPAQPAQAGEGEAPVDSADVLRQAPFAPASSGVAEYNPDGSGSAPAQPSSEPAQGATYQTPSASQMWGQPAPETPAAPNEPEPQPAGDAAYGSGYEAPAAPVAGDDAMAEASQAAEQMTDTVAGAAEDTTRQAGQAFAGGFGQPTAPQADPQPQTPPTQPAQPQPEQPFGSTGYERPGDAGPAPQAQAQPPQAPSGETAAPGAASAPFGGQPDPFTTPQAPQQPSQAQPPAPAQCQGTPEGAVPPAASQTPADEDEEDTTPPKPVTRFNPWN